MTDMDCKDIKAMLSGLVDDHVEPDVRHAAERHLVTCADCRKLLDEAERLNDLIVRDAARVSGLGQGQTLADSFIGEVLRRTVNASEVSFNGRRLINWGGWLAAAACLALAMFLWIGQQRGASNATTSFAAGLGTDASLAQRARMQSWISDAPVASWSLAKPASPDMSREDAETFYAAAQVLSLLEQDDQRNFAAADRIRRIAEYDDLLPRLAQARDRTRDDDRPAVFAAQGVLARLVQGPLSMEDLREAHEISRSLSLSQSLSAMSMRWDRQTAM